MRSRLISLALLAASVGAFGLASRFDFVPVLVWNASASAALGLYRIADRAPELGDLVLVRPDADFENLIVARGYLPEDIPLLKRVAALHGAQICRDDAAIFINGIHVAKALRVDSKGRFMPVWRGCISLTDAEIFLLNAPANSLDGRYFGATKVEHVIGVAIPVLPWESDR